LKEYKLSTPKNFLTKEEKKPTYSLRGYIRGGRGGLFLFIVGQSRSLKKNKFKSSHPWGRKKEDVFRSMEEVAHSLLESGSKSNSNA